jgi:hypothetical protein
MKRGLLVFLVALLLLSSTTIAVSAATITKTLSVVQVKQEKDNWCWAACCEMLIKYFKGTATQYNVVKYTYGDYRNDGANAYQSDTAIDHYQKQGVNGKVTGGLSWTAVQYQISNSCPIHAMRVSYYNINPDDPGHVYVVKGFSTDTNRVWFCDPWDAKNYWKPYNWFSNNGQQYWGASIFYK